MRLPADAALILAAPGGAARDLLVAAWRREALPIFEADEALDAALEAAGVTTLVLCGGEAAMATHMIASGYRVFVVTEGLSAGQAGRLDGEAKLVGLRETLMAAAGARARERMRAARGASDAGAAPSLLVRDARESDMEAAGEIYAHYVLESTATFEETPPSLDEMQSRRRASLDAGLPYLVAEIDGELVGFAYAGIYRPRPAYRFTIEDSVYVAPRRQGAGIGRALLAAVISRCERGRWRQMVAVVGGSENAGSAALHRALGFELVGVLRNVGFKFERWVDTPIFQRELLASPPNLLHK